MLSDLLKSPRKLVTIGVTAALVTAAAAPPAMAWGDREQGIVTGIAGTLLVGSVWRMTHDNRHSKGYSYVPTTYAQPTYYESPVYHTSTSNSSYTPSSYIYTTPMAQAFNSYSEDQQHHIQAVLAAHDFYHSDIDGAFGPATYDAVVAYADSTNQATSLTTEAGAFTLFNSMIY
jgi:hypothetical protein